jgi:IS5 family transposase
LAFKEETKVMTDSGYQGIKKRHHNSEHPKKNSKKRPLTNEEKLENKKIARERVLNENVIGSIKRFKIVSDRYRNRRKRFGLRFNLIAAIHNYEL